MNLLYLNHNVAWSGTFFRAYHLARQMVARGHRVTLVTTDRTARWSVRQEARNGVALVQMPDLLWGRARTGWDPWNVVRRIAYLAGQRFDVIHAFDSRPAVILPALAIRRRSGGLLITDWADWWGRGGTITDRSGWLVRTFFGPVETWFEEAFRQRAVGTTTISEPLARRAMRLGVPAEQIVCLPQGCDALHLVPGDRDRARTALGIHSQELLLVHIGAMYRGDAALLFEAMRLARAGGLPVQVALVGRPGVPLPDAKSLPCMRVGFVSYDVLHRWLAAADACIVPLQDTVANQGRWPSKINDSFAAGRPVIMTDVGDAARYVREAGAGWVSGAGPTALAEAIAAACGDPEGRERAGLRGRGLAEGPLAWSTLAAKLDSFYAGVLAADARREVSGLGTAAEHE